MLLSGLEHDTFVVSALIADNPTLILGRHTREDSSKPANAFMWLLDWELRDMISGPGTLNLGSCMAEAVAGHVDNNAAEAIKGGVSARLTKPL